MKKPHTLRRRGPDYITEALAAVLTSDAWFEFKALFLQVRENLRARNVAIASNGDAEMLRLRAYEKLQNLVQRGAVEKSGKEYRGVQRLLATITEQKDSENLRALLPTLAKADNSGTVSPQEPLPS